MSNKIFDQKLWQIKLLGILIFYHDFAVSCPCIEKSVPITNQIASRQPSHQSDGNITISTESMACAFLIGSFMDRKQ